MRESVFKAIADPQRRKILRVLKSGSMTAGGIAEFFDITKGALSYHFNILKDADLIRCDRCGKEIVYSLNTSVLEELSTTLLDLIHRPVRRTRGSHA